MCWSSLIEDFNFGTSLDHFSLQHQRYIEAVRERRSRMPAPIHQRFDESGNAIFVNNHARNEPAQDEGERKPQNVTDFVTIRESHERFLAWIGACTEADLQDVFEAAGGQLTMTDLRSVAPMIVLACIHDDPLRKPPVASWTVQHLYDFMEWVFNDQGDPWRPAIRPKCQGVHVKAPEPPRAYIGNFLKDMVSSKSGVRRMRTIGDSVYITLNKWSDIGAPSYRYIDRWGEKLGKSVFEPIKGIDPAEKAARMGVIYNARMKEYTEQYNRQLIVFAARWALHYNHISPRRRVVLEAAMEKPPLTLTELKMALYPFNQRFDISLTMRQTLRWKDEIEISDAREEQWLRACGGPS